ncbi:hypothetical protein X975_00679, partial [Stegodyphus mimosarum]
MSNCSQHQLEQLKLISKSKFSSDLLCKCPNSVMKTVCECALNLLRGHLSVSSKRKAQLASYKRSLRKLSNKKVPLYKKRGLVEKGEGFLSVLLPATISVISSLIHGVQYKTSHRTRRKTTNSGTSY